MKWLIAVILLTLLTVVGTFALVDHAYGETMYVNLPALKGYEDNMIVEDTILKGLIYDNGFEVHQVWGYADLQRNLIGVGILFYINEKFTMFCSMTEVNNPLYFKDMKDADKIEVYGQFSANCEEVEEWFKKTLKEK